MRRADRLEQRVDAGACRVDGDACRDLELPFPQQIASAHAGGPSAVRDERHRLDVIGQNRRMLGRGDGEGERQPIGLGRHVVVPHGRTCHATAVQAGKAPERIARHDTSSRQLMRGGDVAIAIVGDDSVQQEAGTHGGHAPGDRPIQGQRERKRAEGVRRDGGQHTSLDHRFTRARDVERLKVAQAAVDRSEVVERGAAAEIGAFDQRDGQAALGGVVRDRQAVDAAADDEHVKGTAGERVDVANQGSLCR